MNPTADPVRVALDNLRRGDKELSEVQRRENLTGQALRRRAEREGDISVDDPGWRAALNAYQLSRHVAREQQEREEAVRMSLLSAARPSGRASWRPTNFMAEFEAWKDRNAGDAWIHSGHPAPDIGPFCLMNPAEIRAALLSTSGYPEPTWRQPGFEPYPGPQLGLVESIAWQPTDFEDPQFMLEASMTNSAAETAEGSAAPEAAELFMPQTTYCQRLPITLPASRQVLDDSPVLEDLLTGRLLYMIKVRLQGQVVAGNGSPGAPSGGLCGIINTPNVLSVTKVTSGSPLQPQVDSIAAAIAAIRTATQSWYEPTDFVINPADAEELSQAKDADGRYIFPPGEPLTPFGLRTTITSSASVGAPLVGCVAALQGYIRGDVLADLSDSHSDFFVRHLIMLRAEGRFGFAVRQPAAWSCIENFDA